MNQELKKFESNLATSIKEAAAAIMLLCSDIDEMIEAYKSKKAI